VLAFGAIFAIFSDLGLAPYTVRQISRLRDQQDSDQRVQVLFTNVLVIRILLSFLTAIIMLLAAWLTGRPLIMLGAIALNSIGLLLYSFHGASEATLSGFERLDIVFGAKVVQQFTFVLLGAVVLVVGLGYYGLILGNLVAISLMTYICWRNVRRLVPHLGSIDFSIWKSLVRASLPFAVIGFALGLSYKFDTILLNIFRGDSETGFYNAAYNLVFSAVLISNVINTSMFPTLTREFANNPGGLPQIFERMLRYLMIVSLPIAVGGSLLATPLVEMLYSGSYAQSATAFQIVVWVIPLMYASEYLGYIVVINNKESRVARAILISTAVNISLNLMLVPVYGLLAASVMTVLTELILVAQHAWSLRVMLHSSNWKGSLLRPLVAALLMGAVVFLIHPHLSLFATIGIGALLYFVLLWLIGAVGQDELRFAREIVATKRPVSPPSS
jgi:O-antigen/teichoic acid export membrane protein